MNAAASAIQNAAIGTSGGLGPDCQGQESQPTSLKVLQGVGAVASVIPGVGFVASLIGAIFRHHRQAIQRDLQFGCTEIPAVNNAFQVLISEVQQGTIAPADAANALPEIYSQYMSAGGASGSLAGPGAIPGGGVAINDSPYCNSNCELSIVVLGMVFYWQSQFLSQVQPTAALALSTDGSGGSAVQLSLGASGNVIVLAIIFGLIAAALF